MLDGAFATARALGADTILIAVDHRRVRLIETVHTMLARRHEVKGRHAPLVGVVGVPNGYVTGQETALISFLSGREAKPSSTPPYPFEKGVRGRPTMVSNVETFAQIGRVVSHTYDASRLVTVSGAVAKTSVVHIREDTTIAAALTAAGGVTERPSAILLGGYGGIWVSVPDVMDLKLHEHALRERGLTLGAGIIHALGESRCGVAEVARVTRWMAGQSAGQCGPCVFGVGAIADALSALCAHEPHAQVAFSSLDQIQRWCGTVNKRGGCAHPDGVARYVTSALRVMAADFQRHAAQGPCERCDAVLARPPISRVRSRSRWGRDRLTV